MTSRRNSQLVSRHQLYKNLNRKFTNSFVLIGNEKKKPKPGHIGQQSAGGKPSGKHLDPVLKQVRGWQRGRWFGYKLTAAMVAQDAAAAMKPKPKKVAQSSPPPAKKLAETSTAKRPAEDDEKATKKPAKKAKVEKKSPVKKQAKK